MLMKKIIAVLFALSLCAIGILLKYFSIPTGRFAIEEKNDVIEISPRTTYDQMISNGILFTVKTIPNPIKGKPSYIIIEQNGALCISKVYINGKLMWSGEKCGNLGVRYVPEKEGSYLIKVYYKKDNIEMPPLQFILEINPVKKVNYLNGEIRIDGNKINDSVSLIANNELNGTISISSSKITTIKRGVLIIIGERYSWIYETYINKKIPPFIKIDKKETIKVPDLPGNYTLIGYLYTDDGGIQKEANITIIRVLNESQS